MGLLRFILAISVVIAHSEPILSFDFVGGKVAVQAFYIVSGFYMALILREKYVGVNNSYKLFITNRFLRLYPIYWIVLLLSIFYGIFNLYSSTNGSTNSLSYYLNYIDHLSFSSLIFLFFTNVFVFFQDTVLFLGLDTSDGTLFFTKNFRETNPMLYRFMFIPQGWTISLELAFYLIAPYLVNKKTMFVLLLIILSFSVRIILSAFGLKEDPWSYRFFPTELSYFLMGILAYRVYTFIRNKEVQKTYFNLCWFGILLFTFLYGFVSLPGKQYIYLFLFFVCLPFIFKLTKNWSIDKFIGELSYPIYISHLLVLSCINSLEVPLMGGLGLNLIVLTILLSVVLNELVTKKVERVRQRRVRTIPEMRFVSKNG